MAAEIKPSCSSERVKLSEVIPLETPFSVYVYPTNCCNFKCVYCAHSMSDSELRERYDFSKDTMSLTTFRETIRQLKTFPKKIKVLSLTGVGEPLLNKNLPEMIKIAKESNQFERIEFISNGALLFPDISEQLIKNGLDTLRISLQGITSEKYKEICGVNIDFDLFMENLRYFFRIRGKARLFVKILDIALEGNEDELFYRLFQDCSDRMFIEKVQPTYDGVALTDELNNKEDRYGRLIEKRKVCPLPFFMLGVFPNGDVQPCDNLYRPVILGNIHSRTIPEMWNSSELRDFWKLHLEGNRELHPKCSLCCAPEDVSQPEDLLDDTAEILLKKLQ